MFLTAPRDNLTACTQKNGCKIILAVIKSFHLYINKGENKMQKENRQNTVELDTDGDGVTDTVYVDLDGDGTLDAAYIDTDGDGIADTVLLDTDGDGEPDTLLFDSDGDGEFESETKLK